MSFEEWYDLHKDDISEKVELRLSLIDLFASAYEAGLHADVHTDNSKVITELESENRRLNKLYTLAKDVVKQFLNDCVVTNDVLDKIEPLIKEMKIEY